jgi:hypothetical protein
MMEKSFEKVKKLTRDFFHYCCFGSITSDAYGYGYVHSHPTNHHEPFLDDAIQCLVDDIEMFVFSRHVVPAIYFVIENLFSVRALVTPAACPVQFCCAEEKSPQLHGFQCQIFQQFSILSLFAIDTFSRLNAILKIRTIANQHILSVLAAYSIQLFFFSSKQALL